MKLLRRRTSASIVRGPFPVLISLGVVALLAIAVAACGDDEKDTGSTGSGTAAATQIPNVTGTISLEGSSTVQPFSIALIDEFAKVYPNVKINPPSGKGSGAGLTSRWTSPSPAAK